MEDSVNVFLGNCAATDHAQVIAELLIKKEKSPKLSKGYKFIRSFKNFNQSQYNQSLAMKQWELLGSTENVNEMASMMNKFLVETLNEIVPLKKVKIRNNHVSALTNETKHMIKERNKARKENLSNYKELRNKCVKLINRDKRNETSRKLDVNPYAIWKIYKELEKGVECSEIKLK